MSPGENSLKTLWFHSFFISIPYGRRAFSIAGPTAWNSISDKLIDPARRQFLKTILFSRY